MLKMKEYVGYRQRKIAIDGHSRNCEHCRHRKFIPIHSCAFEARSAGEKYDGTDKN